MLRSCYLTAAKLYAADGIFNYIQWRFVPDTTPFLPIPTAINSLNWILDRYYVPIDVGEALLPALRSWRNGADFAGPRPASFCGTVDDFLGNGTRPVAWPSGSPYLDCCANKSITLAELLPPFGITAVSGAASDGILVEDMSNLSATWAYDLCQAIALGQGTFYTYQIDLAQGAPSGSGDNLSDFVLITNPAASAGNLDFSGATYPDGFINAEDMDGYPVTFLGSDIVFGPLPVYADVWVCSDGAGQVLAWDFFAGPGTALFTLPTDDLVLTFTIKSIFSYP